AISSLSPDPQPQNLVCLINLMSKYSVTRPIENPREFAIAHPPSLAETAPRQKPAHFLDLLRIPAQSQKNKVNLSDAATTLMPREGVEILAETPEDADAELVAQAQCGKLEAFEELVRRHTRLIYRALIAILGDAADAQDAMQDTLLSAFK